MDKIVVMIDGANLYATIKQLNYDLDFAKLPLLFKDEGVIVNKLYYSAVLENPNTNNVGKLLDYLEYNGYSVVKKFAREFTDGNVSKVKGNMDIEIVVDALELAYKKAVDHLVLVSGDGDFSYMLKQLNSYGVSTTVVSTILTNPSMCSDKLRRQANRFIDLGELSVKSLIKRGKTVEFVTIPSRSRIAHVAKR